MNLEASPESSIEHQNVPEAHQGLHSFLYSSENEHSENTDAANIYIENDGTEIVSLQEWRSQLGNAKLAGVYAVLDLDRSYQYIGYSRNISLSLNGHLTQIGDRVCSFVRVKSFKFPKREQMELLRDNWLGELAYIPSGNGADRSMWASTVGEVALSAMTETERHAYEEKKLKIRKAMADSNLTADLEKMDVNDRDRHEKLEAAVVQDDWSAVIQSQHQS